MYVLMVGKIPLTGEKHRHVSFVRTYNTNELKICFALRANFECIIYHSVSKILLPSPVYTNVTGASFFLKIPSGL